MKELVVSARCFQKEQKVMISQTLKLDLKVRAVCSRAHTHDTWVFGFSYTLPFLLFICLPQATPPPNKGKLSCGSHKKFPNIAILGFLKVVAGSKHSLHAFSVLIIIIIMLWM